MHTLNIRRRFHCSLRGMVLLVLLAPCYSVLAQSPCSNSATQAAQANAATSADITDMENAGKFVFGTVTGVAGVGAVVDAFSQALTTGLSETDVVTAQLNCQQTEINAIQTELATLQSEINDLSKVIAGIGNTTLQNVILTDLDTVLKPALAQLNPNGGRRSLSGAQYAPGRNLWGNTGTPVAATTPAAPPVDRATAQNVANLAQGVADLYLNSFDSRWIAFDIIKDGQGNNTPTPTFEPYPALSVYFLALQIWMTAISIEEMQPGATFASIRTNGNFQDLALHRAFLHRLGDSGVGVASQYLPNKLPLPDLIDSRVTCGWTPVSQYPPSNSTQCQAVPFCNDGIQRKTWSPANALPGWNASQTYTFSVDAGKIC